MKKQILAFAPVAAMILGAPIAFAGVSIPSLDSDITSVEPVAAATKPAETVAATAMPSLIAMSDGANDITSAVLPAETITTSSAAERTAPATAEGPSISRKAAGMPDGTNDISS